MICEAAKTWDVACICLDKSDAPAHRLCQDRIVGSTNDGTKYTELAKKSDVLTIEIEKIDLEALGDLNIIPNEQCLKILCNKYLQKEFLQENKIPSAPFFLVTSRSDLERNKDGSFVLKLASGGYDGRGVFTWPNSDLKDDFFHSQVYAEEKQEIAKELAMIVSRNAKGQIASFPATEMQMREDKQLDYLFSPAAIEETLNHQMQDICKNIVTKLNYQGVLAIEFFLTKSGELLVNEMAPRPHNSGHHTIEACESSQFDHVIASAFDWDLPSTKQNQAAAVLNLIGLSKEQCESLLEPEIRGAYLHYYHKAARPGRKVGHICFVAQRLEDAVENLKKVQERIKEYA